jgi:hypothetical protein
MFLEFGPINSSEIQESIFDNVGGEPLVDSAEVIAYLRAGHPLIDMMDVADDVFDTSRQILNGSSVLTDGDWLWRLDLPYYVQRHHVRLPDQFLALIRERQYVVPEREIPLLRSCSQEAKRLMC